MPRPHDHVEHDTYPCSSSGKLIQPEPPSQTLLPDASEETSRPILIQNRCCCMKYILISKTHLCILPRYRARWALVLQPTRAGLFKRNHRSPAYAGMYAILPGICQFPGSYPRKSAISQTFPRQSPWPVQPCTREWCRCNVCCMRRQGREGVGGSALQLGTLRLKYSRLFRTICWKSDRTNSPRL